MKRRSESAALFTGLDDDLDHFARDSGPDAMSQKRRLDQARATLEQLADPDDVDARTIDKAIIADRLKKAAVEAKGLKAFEKCADGFKDKGVELVQTLRSEHRGRPLTRLVFDEHGERLYSADKSGNIIKWNFDGTIWRKQHLFKTKSVLSLAVSPDGTIMLAGLLDGTITAFDTKRNRTLGQLGPNGHRQSVTSLAFQPASMTAYSASTDRTVKLWAVDQLAYIDTLFGHQDEVVGLAALPTADRCVTVGARDRTVRLWKIVEESQLVFRMSETDGGSLDQVAVCRNWILTGSDTGRISVWSLGRKKPIYTIQGHSGPILTLHCPEATDLLFSGSNDGTLKLWRIKTDEEDTGDMIELINSVPIPGHITGAAMLGKDAIAVAVSPEDRLGRWTVCKDIRPSILIFKTH